MKSKILWLLIAVLCIGLQFMGCKEKEVVFEPSRVIKDTAGGFVDIIEPPNVSVAGTLHVAGWAADTRKLEPAKTVVLVVDGKQLFLSPKMRMNREDVAKALGSKNLVKSGWDAALKADVMGKGRHRLEFYGVVGENNFALLMCKGTTYCEIEVRE